MTHSATIFIIVWRGGVLRVTSDRPDLRTKYIVILRSRPAVDGMFMFLCVQYRMYYMCFIVFSYLKPFRYLLSYTLCRFTYMLRIYMHAFFVVMVSSWPTASAHACAMASCDRCLLFIFMTHTRGHVYTNRHKQPQHKKYFYDDTNKPPRGLQQSFRHYFLSRPFQKVPALPVCSLHYSPILPPSVE